jgi:Spy/CpxP family protein refolding chaperone
MKKMMAVLVMLAAAFLPNSSALFAQAESPQPIKDQDIELLRKDLRSERKQIVAANMTLTDAEAQKFWPVYDQYTAEVTKIGDARYALIKQYAQTYNNMTEAQAQNLLKGWLETDRRVVELRQQYVPLFEKVLSAKKTATFFQIDRRLGLMLDLQLGSAIPLAE